MRRLLSLFGLALIAVFVFFPVKSNASGKNLCRTLEAEKLYKYNLDQKGKKESIKVSVSKDERKNGYTITYDIKTMVTVNGRKIYSKSLKGQDTDNNQVKVMVIDTDNKDKQMELLIIEGDISEGTEDGGFWTANMEHIYYYRYVGGKAKRVQDLAPLFRKSFAGIYSLHGMEDGSYLTTNGKNEIYARLCIKIENFDYVHIKMKLNLKKGKFVKTSAKFYNLIDIEESYFRPKKNITVYTKPGGTKKAFVVKKKESIYLCGLYTANGKKMYLKVRNNAGKTGYIDPKKTPTYLDGTNHV